VLPACQIALTFFLETTLARRLMVVITSKDGNEIKSLQVRMAMEMTIIMKKYKMKFKIFSPFLRRFGGFFLFSFFAFLLPPFIKARGKTYIYTYTK
jgi:hypothetical protein